MEKRKLITIKEAAKEIGYHESTIRNWINQQLLEYVNDANNIQLISLDDVKRVKQQNLQNIIDARFNKKGKAQYSNQLKLEGFREEEMFAKLLLQTTEKMSLMDAALQLLPAEKMVHRLSELGYHGQLTPPPISL